ncbi:MAG: 16S rRNA (guanine(527)-N(7))-methyltransferase RsmG [Nitrospiraceae bacterium]
MFHVEHAERLPDLFTAWSSELHLDIPNDVVLQFLFYLEELLIWNEKINLTTITGKTEILAKHFIDSLFGLQLIEDKLNLMVLDVGSGAGFPGLPLKMIRPDLRLVLVEPNHKKVSFLRNLIGKLRLNETVVCQQTIKECASQANRQNTFDYVVMRALNPLNVLPCVRSVLTNDGRVIIYRGKPFESGEMECAGLQIEQQVSYALPGNFGNRTLTLLAKIC